MVSMNTTALLIIFDRFTLENANSVILGKSGWREKSFMVKLEALRLLMMGTDVIIIDPENEYEKLVPAVGGEISCRFFRIWDL